MKAHFPFLEVIGEKIVVLGTLITMVFWMYPGTLEAIKIAQASEAKPEALVFEIDPNQKQNLHNQKTETQTSITYDSLLESDPLVTDIVAYIKQKAPNSPLANPHIVAHILTHTGKTHERDVWMRALAISYVESHMCTYTPKRAGIESHNCSGIIAGKGYKMYASYEDWFSDMVKLLQKPNYVNRPLKSYLKYYVQPGSPRWYNGVVDVESKLVALHTNALEKRIALSGHQVSIAATTDIELVK